MRLRRKRLLLSALQKPRRIYQRNILQKRPAVGEFSTLVSDLKSEPKDFFTYFRMQRAAFDEILDLVKEKIWHLPNHQSPIYPEQRLAVTVTFLFDFQMVVRIQITPMFNNIRTSRNNRIKQQYRAVRRFLKTLCFYPCNAPRQAFRFRIPRNSEMRLRFCLFPHFSINCWPWTKVRSSVLA